MKLGLDDEHDKHNLQGPEAAKRFEDNMSRLLKVSKEELARREAAYQEASHAKPARRGPKPHSR